jgi:hypothetical protein
MKAKCWLVFGLLIVTAISAQGGSSDVPYETLVPDEPFAQMLYTYEGVSKFHDTDMPDTEVSIHEVEMLATPVYKQVNNLEFALTLAAQWDRFVFEAANTRDEDVYRLMAMFDFLYNMDAWTFWLELTPGLFSDLERIESDDYRTLFHAMVMYQLMDTLQLGLGLAYDRQFGDDTLYPMFGAIWDLPPSWKLELVLPMPRIVYAPSEKLACFIDARPAGDLWNIRDDDDLKNYDFKLEGYRLGVGLEYEILDHVWLHAAGGWSFERKYEIAHEDDKLLDSDADDTWFGRVGLVFR